MTHLALVARNNVWCVVWMTAYLMMADINYWWFFSLHKGPSKTHTHAKRYTKEWAWKTLFCRIVGDFRESIAVYKRATRHQRTPAFSRVRKYQMLISFMKISVATRWQDVFSFFACWCCIDNAKEGWSDHSCIFKVLSLCGLSWQCGWLEPDPIQHTEVIKKTIKQLL